MANEGSTKATYSELERKVAENEATDAALTRAMDGLRLRVEAAETSLARVRGLLQRQWISVEERLPDENVRVFAYGLLAGACTAVYAYPSRWYGDGMPSEPAITHWQPIEPPNFRESSSLVPEGAESADLGKLDGADKHIHEWKLKGQVLEPDADGIYRLAVWDGSKIERRVPSGWSECPCGSYKVEKVNGEEVEVGRGVQQIKSSTGSESPLAVPLGVEMGKVNRVDEKAE